jgi:hypothetical protein
MADIFNTQQRIKPVELVIFSAAFDKLVYGEGKYYQFHGRLSTTMLMYSKITQ